MKESDTLLAGKLALWLTGLFAVAVLPIPVLNLFRSRPIQLPLELVAPYLFGCLATFMAYVYGRIELSLERQEQILRQPVQGIEVFTTSHAFIQKLIEITVGSETVSTLNLSPPKGEHPNLDVYFDRVHHYIRGKRTPLRSFRSIASLDSHAKIAWLLERSAALAPTGKASFAVFSQAHVESLGHPLSFHVTYKGGHPFVFVFPPVDLTGTMDPYLIKNEAVARIMVEYFNKLWERSVVLNEGRRVRSDGLRRLLDLDPGLESNLHFNLLKEMAN